MNSNARKLPEFITFTGIDDRTDLTRANDLARQYPIEWGVLFSPHNRDARFPCWQAMLEILSIGGRKSAHLCGGYARAAMKTAEISSGIPLSRFDRTQLNGNSRDCSLWTAQEIRERFSVNVIFQHREPNFYPGETMQLYDLSGGRGEMPERLPLLPSDPNQIVGYAGGMGPDTVLDYLDRIDGGSAKFWIDMEGRVRTDGWFDLDKAQRVCEAVYG